MSSSTSSDDVVSCPSCSKSFTYGQLNAHLDRCLGIDVAHGKKKRSAESDPDSERTAAASSSQAKTPLTKRLREDGQDDSGVGHRAYAAPANTPAASSSMRGRLDSVAPLAERLRPQTLDDFVGQEAVVGGPLKALLARGIVPNAILWGPPGTGKTTLARILARTTSTSSSSAPSSSKAAYRFVEISATTASTVEVKKIFDEATSRLLLTGQRTILFIDEIQRFSRAQQDVFLPIIEKGHCILIAATTENPSFRLQNALLSRMRVFVLTKLSVEECLQVLQRAKSRVSEGEQVVASLIDDTMLRWIAEMADGDARTALGALEIALVTLNKDDSSSSEERLNILKANLKRTTMQYDRTGDHHYDTISALHKSIRGSNADAALYWLARMVESGDDPLFIARRMIVAASEDCNTLEALQMANATYQACQVVGLPECAENLAQCVVFLAESPKSTRAYRGWKKAQALVRESYNFPVPIHIRNAPTKLMRDLGHGLEYRYEPSFAHPVRQEFFPPELRGTRLVSPPPQIVQEDTQGLVSASVADAKQAPSGPRMPKENGIGPGACQRIFQVGARSVDLDLLEEWERECNGGRPWPGREKLMQTLEEENGKRKN